MPRRLLLILIILAVLSFPLLADETDTYCYDLLTETEQLAYDAIYNSVIYLLPSWNCGSMSQETIQKAFDCLIMDRPEIYWPTGYTYVTSYLGNTISGHRVEFTYSLDRQTIKNANKDIEAAIMEIAESLERIDPSYEAVKGVYEYFIRNCTYDELNLDQTLCAVMIGKSGVCASFSKAFQLMMQCLGIPCTVVLGRLTQSEGVLGTTLGHEWNLVQLDGKWYHVDVTSGLALSEDDDMLDYRYLCASTEEILKTHIIEHPLELPQCTSNDLEFFRYHGLMVDSYSRTAVMDCMLRAKELGYEHIVRFSNYHAFSDAIDDLFTNQGIFDAMEDATGEHVDSINYSIDEDELIIRLY